MTFAFLADGVVEEVAVKVRVDELKEQINDPQNDQGCPNDLHPRGSRQVPENPCVHLSLLSLGRYGHQGRCGHHFRLGSPSRILGRPESLGTQYSISDHTMYRSVFPYMG